MADLKLAVTHRPGQQRHRSLLLGTGQGAILPKCFGASGANGVICIAHSVEKRTCCGQNGRGSKRLGRPRSHRRIAILQSLEKIRIGQVLRQRQQAIDRFPTTRGITCREQRTKLLWKVPAASIQIRRFRLYQGRQKQRGQRQDRKPATHAHSLRLYQDR